MSKIEMPSLVIEMIKQQDFFIANHLIDKQIPIYWQKFFEKELKIVAPDCYQYHCFLTKWNAWNIAQPRF